MFPFGIVLPCKMEVALILSSFSFQKFIEAFECGLLLLSPLDAFSLFPVVSHPPPFIIGVFSPFERSFFLLVYTLHTFHRTPTDRKNERARAKMIC